MKFYGQFNNPKVDEYIYNRFFSHNPKNGIVIEAGAEEGLIIPNSRVFEEQLGWKAINVEANPVLFKKLSHNRCNSTNLNFALSSQENSGKQLDFQMYNVGLGYVIDEVNDNHKKYTDEYARTTHLKKGIVKVNCISYADLVKKTKINKVDLLVLDIEGSEIKVLQDLKETSVIPQVICVEDNLGEKKFFDEILFALGYKFDKKIHVNLHYYLDV